MTFLEKLVELLLQFWSTVAPYAILGDDQIGLIRRFGKYHRDMQPGINWKIPLVEQPMAETSAYDSATLRDQSLTTSDGAQVTVRGVITYRVVDARRYILEVDNPVSVLNDVGCLIIGELIPTLTAEQVMHGADFLPTLTRKVKARAKRWGIEVDSVGLVDRTKARAIRLLVSDARDGAGIV